MTRSSLAASALLFLAIFLVYGRGLQGYFMADDFGFLSFSRVLSGMDLSAGLKWFWLSREGVGPEVAKLYRPLNDLSFAWQYRVLGADAFSFRLVNLLVHAASSCLVMGIAWRLLRLAPVAIAAGLLFALSPAHPESLLWISSRMNLMAGFFILLALYAFMHRGAEAGRLPGAIALCAVTCAMFSKETGLISVPLLSVYAFCCAPEAGSSLRERLVFSMRATWPAWLLLIGYFALRYKALGILLGGYDQIDAFSAGYWFSRMHLPLLYLSPVHLGELPHWCKYALLILNLGLLIAAVRYLRVQALGAAVASFGLGWALLSLLPTYAAPFGESTWTLLQNSRLLYEPSLPLAILLAVGLAGITSTRVAMIAVACLALINGSIAWANTKPWIEMGKASEVVRAKAEQWQSEDFTERWLVEVPGVESGAYLFYDRNPALRAPAFPVGLDERVTLRRRSQWQQLMQRVDRALSEGNAGELELYRFELGDLSIERESIPSLFISMVGKGMNLHYLRPARRKLHAGEAIPIQAIFGELPIRPSVLRVALHGKNLNSVAGFSHEITDTLANWTLQLPEDLTPGSYELRFGQHEKSADDHPFFVLCSIEILPN